MSTAAEQAAVRSILADVDDPVIVELGAYQGEDSVWIRAACKAEPHYIMVEADRRHVTAAVEKTEGHHKTRVLFGAIAAEPGIATLHVCDNSTGQAKASSSIRKPSGHLKHFPWCEFPREENVPAYTLDEVAERYSLDHIDLLWVDIQGAERDMIAGGQAALAKTRYLFIESEQVEMYEGQALRPELLAMLPDFEVIEEFDYNLLMRNKSCT